jgi:DNA-directed RNA polymerase subunit H (RpoH/RPB5)
MSVISTDYIYRSRITILDILEERGYNTKPYRKFSPKEIDAFIANYTSLNMLLSHQFDEEKRCIVNYLTSRITKQKVGVFFDELLEKMGVEDEEDRKNYEGIFLLQDPLSDTHHLTALSEWTTHKRRIAFFHIPQIVLNPMKHILVPLHTIVPSEQHADLMKDLNITSKTQLPIIRFHQDAIARCLGLVPGDIVKITRPSPSAGTYTVYRICTP